MTPLLLVTGFLGAGKTTFLKRLLPALGAKNVRVIVNEFGRENVDEKLLAETRARLTSIEGGSILCTCRLDLFEKALDQSLADAPDAIVVETSGLTDPTGICRVLKRYPSIAYQGCVCLTDARRLPKICRTAVVVSKQLAAADLVIVNKCDQASPEEIALAESVARERAPLAKILRASFGDVPIADVLALRAHGGTGFLTADLNQHAAQIPIDPAASLESLEAFVRGIAGGVFRVKGVVSCAEGRVLVDCVEDDVRISFAPSLTPNPENALTVLYGYGQKPPAPFQA